MTTKAMEKDSETTTTDNYKLTGRRELRQARRQRLLGDAKDNQLAEAQASRAQEV